MCAIKTVCSRNEKLRCCIPVDGTEGPLLLLCTSGANVRSDVCGFRLMTFSTARYCSNRGQRSLQLGYPPPTDSPDRTHTKKMVTKNPVKGSLQTLQYYLGFRRRSWKRRCRMGGGATRKIECTGKWKMTVTSTLLSTTAKASSVYWLKYSDAARRRFEFTHIGTKHDRWRARPRARILTRVHVDSIIRSEITTLCNTSLNVIVATVTHGDICAYFIQTSDTPLPPPPPSYP